MKQAYYLFFLLLLIGCAPSNYGVTELQPTLKLNFPQTCEEGKPFTVSFTVQQEGVSAGFALSTSIISGQAHITVGKEEIPTTGQWVSLTQTYDKLIITPGATGTLRISFQVKSPIGTSERQILTTTVSRAANISAYATCASELINPEEEERLPIRLNIAKPDYTGNFTVSVKLRQGKGSFFHDGNSVNDMEFSAGTTDTVEYYPDILGEHLIEFTVKAGSKTTSALAYVDVIKEISVQSPVKNCFTIKGIGKHNKEGETVILSLENNGGYNFEVAAWCDTLGRPLSTQKTYDIKLSKTCLSALTVKLAKRFVTITRGEENTIERVYYIMQNGKAVKKSVYDCSTALYADYGVMDKLLFRYDHTSYNMSVTPPAVNEYTGTAYFDTGGQICGYFWNRYGDFNIRMYRADHPDLIYNVPAHYIESATTRYFIPGDIPMQ